MADHENAREDREERPKFTAAGTTLTPTFSSDKMVRRWLLGQPLRHLQQKAPTWLMHGGQFKSGL